MILSSVVFFMDSVAYPVWVLLLANIDAFIKLLTPTNLISFIKQGTIGIFKRKAIGIAPEVIVEGYSPWRRKLDTLKRRIFSAGVSMIAWYRSQSLAAQVGVAGTILMAGASTGYTVLAFLIIPQPVIVYIKTQAIAVANKTGMSKVYDSVVKKIAPKAFRKRYNLFFKWRIGRRKVILSRKIHARMRETALAV